MTLTTAAVIYYAIAIPTLILICKMMWVGGRDSKRPKPIPYDEQITNAHKRLTVDDDYLQRVNCEDNGSHVSIRNGKYHSS